MMGLGVLNKPVKINTRVNKNTKTFALAMLLIFKCNTFCRGGSNCILNIKQYERK